MTAPRPRPVWCPHDTRKLAGDAARVEPKPRLRDWLWAPLLIASLALIPLATAPHAKANPETDAVVTYATTICQRLDNTPGADAVADMVNVFIRDGYTTGQAVNIVTKSVIAFCDNHIPDVQAFVDQYGTNTQGKGMAV